MVLSSKNANFEVMQQMISKLQEEVVEINTQRLKIKEAELLWSTENKLHHQRLI